MAINIKSNTYVIINAIFAVIIVFIVAYFYLFSPERDDYPVACVHELLTGQPCASCGLSHGLSYVVRGDLSSAKQWNENSVRVFLFFAIQFVMRLLFSLLSLGSNGRAKVVTIDALLSLALFIYAFWPFAEWMISMLKV